MPGLLLFGIVTEWLFVNQSQDGCFSCYQSSEWTS